MGLLREPEPNAEIFSPNWFCGVSVLNVPSEKAELLLNNSTRRSDALKRLVESIPSEMADPDHGLTEILRNATPSDGKPVLTDPGVAWDFTVHYKTSLRN